MLDFSKLADAVGGWFSAGGVAEAIQQGPLSDILERAGVDASVLEGLSGDEVLTQLQSLAEAGELPAQVADAVGQLGSNADISQLLETLTSGGERGG